MFDLVRNARTRAVAASAGIVVVATIIGAGVSAADTPKAKVTEVSLQNTLKVTVEVTFSGDEALKKISPWQSSGDGSARVIAKVPDGTTVKWEAKPKNDQDKNQFTSCKGEKKVSGSSATIVMAADSCGKANAAPKNDANNAQANNKTPEKSTDSAGGSMKITFENTMDNQEGVSLRIWDLAVPGVIQETSMSAGILNGKPSGLPHTTTDATVRKDKSGKYSIDIEFHCGNRGGTAKYHSESASKIRIAKSSGGGCEIKKL